MSKDEEITKNGQRRQDGTIAYSSETEGKRGIIFPSPIFGPVHSRRLGVSLGVNLLPGDGKVCSFDCIYCECGYNKSFPPHQKLPTRTEVRQALRAKLQEMKEIGPNPDVITFALPTSFMTPLPFAMSFSLKPKSVCCVIPLAFFVKMCLMHCSKSITISSSSTPSTWITSAWWTALFPHALVWRKSLSAWWNSATDASCKQCSWRVRIMVVMCRTYQTNSFFLGLMPSSASSHPKWWYIPSTVPPLLHFLRKPLLLNSITLPTVCNRLASHAKCLIDFKFQVSSFKLH